MKSASGYEPGGGLRAQEVLGYGYDRAGNLHYRTNNKLAQTFTVDTVNQLSTVTRNSTMTVAGATTMPAASVTVNGQSATNYGDRTFAKTGVSLADGTNPFTAIAQDSKGRCDTNAITVYLPASQSFYYDANGNLTNDGRRYFFYDGDDQLTQVVVSNAWRTDFQYDGQRRRRITRDYAWQNSTWTKTNEVRYVYDGMLVIQERDANNIPIKTYTRGLDLSGSLQGAGGIGGLLAMTDHKDITARHYYYHGDANENVTALINEQQVVMARYAYDPFGNQLMSVGQVSVLNSYRFSSKEWHPNSGLYYYGYRFYEPNLQRWINRDPIEESGGQNLYRINNNNCIDNIDAFGLFIAPLPPGGGHVGWLPNQPYNPHEPAPPPTPKYPIGFALCMRSVNIAPSDPWYVKHYLEAVDTLGGEHTYIQYVHCDHCSPLGWGFSGGNPRPGPDKEKHFDPSSCKVCERTNCSLKYGYGKSTKGINATDAEIIDCIKNSPIKKKYNPYLGKGFYVCKTWADETVNDCGLSCK